LGVPLPSDAARSLQGLAGRDNLTAIVVAAGRADVVRALQLAAIRALMVRLRGQGQMAAAHATAGRRNFSLRNGHGAGPLFSLVVLTK